MLQRSVEFLFDPKTEQAIQDSWTALGDVGVPPRLQAAGIRPHLTVAAFCEDWGELPHALEGIATRSRPVPLSLVAAGTLAGDEGVVYLAPVLSRGLLRLHAELSGACEQHVSLDDLYRPGMWVPHCTQSLFLDRSQVAEAVAVSQGRLPIHGEIVAVGLHETEIHRPPDRLPEVKTSHYSAMFGLGGD